MRITESSNSFVASDVAQERVSLTVNGEVRQVTVISDGISNAKGRSILDTVCLVVAGYEIGAGLVLSSFGFPCLGTSSASGGTTGVVSVVAGDIGFDWD